MDMCLNTQYPKLLTPQLSLITLTPQHAAQMALIESQAHSHPMSEANLADCFGHLYRVFGLMLTGDDNKQTLIGFTIVQQIIDEVTLMDICLSPAQQGHGYGKLMLDEVVQTAKGAAAVVVMLEVRESNLAARSLYQKSGFVESGRRKAYYPIEGGAEDAILMDLVIHAE